jgi:threonine synthase
MPPWRCRLQPRRHAGRYRSGDLLRPFFAGDRWRRARCHLPRSLRLRGTLRALEANTFLLELFHGPTAAFKDFGARFLAACLRRLRDPDERH